MYYQQMLLCGPATGPICGMPGDDASNAARSSAAQRQEDMQGLLSAVFATPRAGAPVPQASWHKLYAALD